MLLLGGYAQVPECINYQGRLVDQNGLVNDVVQMVFRLYDAEDGGELLYAETQTVAVVDGLYSAHIGASNAVAGAFSAALSAPPVYLELQVDGQMFSPRDMLASVPYALHVAEEGVGKQHLGMGSVGGSVGCDYDSVRGSQVYVAGQGAVAYVGAEAAGVAPYHLNLVPAGLQTIRARHRDGRETGTVVNVVAGEVLDNVDFTPSKYCGDGTVDPGEECDDGNNNDGDGCHSDCTEELCGNGILDPGEQCDDGNNDDGDGCAADCTLEEG